mmetsp:Transcript_1714/g.3174  ORF Transcript_1714/g.3174 Transcript_1714/m.3174 type:complete len:214 (-) Transcript_1714:53-694(-)
MCMNHVSHVTIQCLVDDPVELGTYSHIIWEYHDESQSQQENTTDNDEEALSVMLRNIPFRCTQQDVLDLIAEHGWADSLNFFYMPMPRGRSCKGNFGYAFIGFPDPRLAKQFMLDMKGVEFSSRRSAKVLDVAPARIQGLSNNLSLTGKHACRAIGTTRSHNQKDIAQEAMEALMMPTLAKGGFNQQGRPGGLHPREHCAKRIKNAKLANLKM